MSVKLVEEKKEISDKDIRNIVETAAEFGSINFNMNLYTEDELVKIAMAIEDAYNNLRSASSQMSRILRSKSSNAHRKLHNYRLSNK